MAKAQGAVIIDEERCKGCNLCVVACPMSVLTLGNVVNHRGYNYCIVDTNVSDKCTGCTSCAIVCPDACITVYRTKNAE